MRTLNLCIVILALSFASVSAQTTRELQRDKIPTTSATRTALVIGNGAYDSAPLKNPPNDANDIAAALKSLGFEVMSYTNLDQTGMKRAIREFGTKLRAKGGVGLFYYAGHGVQVKGTNYLVPIGAKVNTEEEVEYESVEAGLAIAQMESAKNELNIVILDACRNNPFARSMRSADKGLASIDAPSGTLIAYSTAPGSVASDGTGRNGLYTQELLKRMTAPGLSIEDVFKQVRISVRSQTSDKQTPWEVSSLTGNFRFSGSDDSQPIAATMPVGESTRSENAGGSYSEYFTKADEALQNNDIIVAIDFLKKAIDADSSKPGAYEKLGSIYFRRMDAENTTETVFAALKNGGSFVIDDVADAASSLIGILTIRKSKIYFAAGKERYEAETSDISTVEVHRRTLSIKFKPGKIIKGTKNDTELNFVVFNRDPSNSDKKKALLESYETKAKIIEAVLLSLRS